MERYREVNRDIESYIDSEKEGDRGREVDRGG